ncbi:hypothetical protein [Halomarina rubra]|uniref:Cox cluster protein n=1 Tax=Halomarina rubra TaxID=2071873 RepID=A0ABD6AX61_9EURY|nr:hypothetical protein [Halomarina rubra]
MSRTSTYSSTHAPTTRRVDSNWWQLVALAGAFFVLAYLVGLFVFVAVFASFLFGVAGGPPELLVGGFGLVFVVVAVFVLAGIVLGLLLPVALYYDAAAVDEAAVGWSPDPTLYAVVGVAGLFVQGLQPAVAFYYLYKRRQAVGTP